MKTKNKYEVKLTKEILAQVESELKFWEEQGQRIPGVHPDCSLDHIPDWLDDEKLKKAQKVAKDLYMSFGLSSLVGLLFVVQLPKGLGPLLATGQSKNTSSLFTRYLSTVQHVNSWYLMDLLNPTSKAHKSLRLVRSMHKRAGEMMNRKYPLDRVDFKAEMLQSPNPLEPTDEKSNPIDEANKTYWVNQYDMLLTQWAFVGPLLLEPVAHGAHGHSIESMELVMYLWRVIGHFIGIHPRFNLFTDCNYALGYARCKIVLERVYAPTLTRLATAQGARMSMAIVKSMRYYNPYLSWSSVMRRAYELFNIDAKRINRLVREERERVRAERRGQTFESTWTTRPDSSLPATEEDDPICDENANTLSDEERRLKLIEAGYNDRYEVLVWDGLPVERIQLASTRDQLMNTLMRFQINCSFKWQPMRSFARNANLLRQRRAQANRNKLQKSCAKSYDDAWRFDKCPFSAAIGTVEYHDFSYVLSEKMKTKSS